MTATATLNHVIVIKNIDGFLLKENYSGLYSGYSPSDGFLKNVTVI